MPCRNEITPDVTTVPADVTTDAVKVTGRPRVLGLGEPVTVVRVKKGTTLTESVELVEPMIGPIPEYTAVIAVDPRGSDVVVSEAEPLLPTATVPSSVEPCTKLTLPTETGAVLVETDAVPAPWALIRVPAEQKYSDVLRVVEALRASGISTIRLEPPVPK